MESEINWRMLLVAIHAKGMSWPGIARELDSNERTVSNYANNEDTSNGRLKIDERRAKRILQLHRGCCPKEFKEKVRPLLMDWLDLVAPDMVVQRLAEG